MKIKIKDEENKERTIEFFLEASAGKINLMATDGHRDRHVAVIRTKGDGIFIDQRFGGTDLDFNITRN